METTRESELEGARGRVVVHEWHGEADPRFVAIISHGYGEHARRYDHVAERLVGGGRRGLRARPPRATAAPTASRP